MSKPVQMESGIRRMASVLDTLPVLNMDDIHAHELKDKSILDALGDITYCVIMDNHEILFYDMQYGYKEARECEKQLSEFDLKVKLRPTTEQIYKLVKYGNEHGSADGDELLLHDNQNRTPAQQFLDALVSAAEKLNTSDIHIYTDNAKNTSEIRFGIDNKLELKTGTLYKKTAEEIIQFGSMIVSYESHMSSGSSKEDFDENTPNDASVVVQTMNRSVKLRYAHTPISTPDGIAICLRLLSASGDGYIPSFKELRYKPLEEHLQRTSFKYYSGIVIYTGPTGSGKSTALSAGVSTIPKYKKIISLEDPVENRMPGVLQIQINRNNPKTTYEAYAKAILRQAPNVIIYGEINSPEVLEAAITQANTGHLVLTTLHTNTAIEAINRMVDLGASWGRLASDSLIRTIVAQRLVEVLCGACSIPLIEAIKLPWATDDHARIFQYFNENHSNEINKIKTVNKSPQQIPCSVCNGRGEIGRMPIVEIIALSTTCRDYIEKADLKGWARHLKKQNWKSMYDSATGSVLRGEICPLTAESKIDSQYGVSDVIIDYKKMEDDLNLRQSNKLNVLKDKIMPAKMISINSARELKHD